MKYVHNLFAFPACLLITAFLLLTSDVNAEIRIEWSEEYGYPDVVDWNWAYRDLYAGYPYEIIITIYNGDEDDLEIAEIYCENEFFFADPQNLLIHTEESEEVSFIFEADEPGEYEAAMVLEWNVADEPEIEIPLVAVASLPPVITVIPQEIDMIVLPGEILEIPINVSNQGGGELRFWGAIVINQQPNGMDYEWRDNDEERGPEFEWFYLEELDDVRVFELGDNENTGRIDLGWTFPFWDREFDHVYCHSDGWMSFTNDGDHTMADEWGEFPHDGETRNCIQVCNRDNREGTDLFFWTVEAGLAVIEWHGDGTYRHQLILYDNGLAVMQYGEGMDGQDFWHVGVNYGDGEHGWAISNNEEGYLTEGRAIGFGEQRAWHDWISVEHVEDGFIIILDFTEPVGGCYIAELRIFSNDPIIEDYLAVNISFEVIPIPNIDVTPGGPEMVDDELEPPVDFGEVYVGYPEEYIVQIANTGSDDLEIYEAIFEDESAFWIEYEDLPDEIPPYEIVEVPIEFNPPLPDNPQDESLFYEEIIHFFTNDARYPEDDPYPVRVQGWGIDATVVTPNADTVIPTDFEIASVYPNPFNSNLRVDYSLPEAADIKLNVYDLSGRLVDELVSGREQAGVHTVMFNGSGLANGVYMLRYKAAGHTSQMKVVLVK